MIPVALINSVLVGFLVVLLLLLVSYVWRIVETVIFGLAFQRHNPNVFFAPFYPLLTRPFRELAAPQYVASLAILRGDVPDTGANTLDRTFSRDRSEHRRLLLELQQRQEEAKKGVRRRQRQRQRREDSSLTAMDPSDAGGDPQDDVEGAEQQDREPAGSSSAEGVDGRMTSRSARDTALSPEASAAAAAVALPAHSMSDYLNGFLAATSGSSSSPGGMTATATTGSTNTSSGSSPKAPWKRTQKTSSAATSLDATRTAPRTSSRGSTRKAKTEKGAGAKARVGGATSSPEDVSIEIGLSSSSERESLAKKQKKGVPVLGLFLPAELSHRPAQRVLLKQKKMKVELRPGLQHAASVVEAPHGDALSLQEQQQQYCGVGDEAELLARTLVGGLLGTDSVVAHAVDGDDILADAAAQVSAEHDAMARNQLDAQGRMTDLYVALLLRRVASRVHRIAAQHSKTARDGPDALTPAFPEEQVQPQTTLSAGQRHEVEAAAVAHVRAVAAVVAQAVREHVQERALRPRYTSLILTSDILAIRRIMYTRTCPPPPATTQRLGTDASGATAPEGEDANALPLSPAPPRTAPWLPLLPPTAKTHTVGWGDDRQRQRHADSGTAGVSDKSLAQEPSVFPMPSRASRWNSSTRTARGVTGTTATPTTSAMHTRTRSSRYLDSSSPNKRRRDSVASVHTTAGGGSSGSFAAGEEESRHFFEAREHAGESDEGGTAAAQHHGVGTEDVWGGSSGNMLESSYTGPSPGALTAVQEFLAASAIADNNRRAGYAAAAMAAAMADSTSSGVHFPGGSGTASPAPSSPAPPLKRQVNATFADDPASFTERWSSSGALSPLLAPTTTGPVCQDRDGEGPLHACPNLPGGAETFLALSTGQRSSEVAAPTPTDLRVAFIMGANRASLLRATTVHATRTFLHGAVNFVCFFSHADERRAMRRRMVRMDRQNRRELARLSAEAHGGPVEAAALTSANRMMGEGTTAAGSVAAAATRHTPPLKLSSQQQQHPGQQANALSPPPPAMSCPHPSWDPRRYAADGYAASTPSHHSRGDATLKEKRDSSDAVPFAQIRPSRATIVCDRERRQSQGQAALEEEEGRAGPHNARTISPGDARDSEASPSRGRGGCGSDEVLAQETTSSFHSDRGGGEEAEEEDDMDGQSSSIKGASARTRNPSVQEVDLADERATERSRGSGEGENVPSQRSMATVRSTSADDDGDDEDATFLSMLSETATEDLDAHAAAAAERRQDESGAEEPPRKPSLPTLLSIKEPPTTPVGDTAGVASLLLQTTSSLPKRDSLARNASHITPFATSPPPTATSGHGSWRSLPNATSEVAAIAQSPTQAYHGAADRPPHGPLDAAPPRRGHAAHSDPQATAATGAAVGGRARGSATAALMGGSADAPLRRPSEQRPFRASVGVSLPQQTFLLVDPAMPSAAVAAAQRQRARRPPRDLTGGLSAAATGVTSTAAEKRRKKKSARKAPKLAPSLREPKLMECTGGPGEVEVSELALDALRSCVAAFVRTPSLSSRSSSDAEENDRRSMEDSPSRRSTTTSARTYSLSVSSASTDSSLSEQDGSYPTYDSSTASSSSSLYETGEDDSSAHSRRSGRRAAGGRGHPTRPHDSERRKKPPQRRAPRATARPAAAASQRRSQRCVRDGKRGGDSAAARARKRTAATATPASRRRQKGAGTMRREERARRRRRRQRARTRLRRRLRKHVATHPDSAPVPVALAVMFFTSVPQTAEGLPFALPAAALMRTAPRALRDGGSRRGARDSVQAGEDKDADASEMSLMSLPEGAASMRQPSRLSTSRCCVTLIYGATALMVASAIEQARRDAALRAAEAAMSREVDLYDDGNGSDAEEDLDFARSWTQPCHQSHTTRAHHSRKNSYSLRDSFAYAMTMPGNGSSVARAITLPAEEPHSQGHGDNQVHTRHHSVVTPAGAPAAPAPCGDPAGNGQSQAPLPMSSPSSFAATPHRQQQHPHSLARLPAVPLPAFHGEPAVSFPSPPPPHACVVSPDIVVCSDEEVDDEASAPGSVDGMHRNTGPVAVAEHGSAAPTDGAADGEGGITGMASGTTAAEVRRRGGTSSGTDVLAPVTDGQHFPEGLSIPVVLHHIRIGDSLYAVTEVVDRTFMQYRERRVRQPSRASPAAAAAAAAAAAVAHGAVFTDTDTDVGDDAESPSAGERSSNFSLHSVRDVFGDDAALPPLSQQHPDANIRARRKARRRHAAVSTMEFGDLTYSFAAPAVPPEPGVQRQLVHMCWRCLSAEARAIFLPCGHYAACETCAEEVSDCCVCKQKILSVVILHDEAQC